MTKKRQRTTPQEAAREADREERRKYTDEVFDRLWQQIKERRAGEAPR